jgi:hypothetical protein
MRSLWTVSALLLPAAEPDAGPHPLPLTPARPAEPALRCRLLPELLEQRPGNAADRFRKADELLRAAADDKTLDRVRAWNKAPPDAFPRAEARALLKTLAKALAEAEAGALCESCDWGHTAARHDEWPGDVYVDTLTMRDLGAVFAARQRLELADGDTERALGTLRTLFALARRAGESPTHWGFEAGRALAVEAADRLEETLRRPDAPNLYWALADLPRPFLDLRRTLQHDRLFAYRFCLGEHAAAAFDRNAEPLTPEATAELGRRLARNRPSFTGTADRRAFAFAVVRKDELAREALIAAGRPRAKVEAMPSLQVAALHALLEYDEYLDECMKWQAAPYGEAERGLAVAISRVVRADVASRNGSASSPALNLAPWLLPPIRKMVASRAALDRRLALLRCVEAIRDHAAAHDGRLPASLSDIKDLPLPLDPVTGRPFLYEVKGDAAVLSSAPLGGRTDWPDAPSYELSIRK